MKDDKIRSIIFFYLKSKIIETYENILWFFKKQIEEFNFIRIIRNENMTLLWSIGYNLNLNLNQLFKLGKMMSMN